MAYNHRNFGFMRKALAILATLCTAALVWLLSHPIGDKIPALGPLLEPVHGWAANAEPAGRDWTENLNIKGLQAPVEVWLEDRLVPHIRAQNDHDLYVAQGYLHARFRLWQMDLQTRAATGRVSEVVGARALDFDNGQRRKGMGYAAENSLRAMEADPRTKAMLDAYTAGVNAFIAQTRAGFDLFAGTAVATPNPDYNTPVFSRGSAPLPLEYKLMGFRPEWWTNLRTALLMKYMADDLTGYTEDIALTQLRDALPAVEFDFLYPERIQGSKPAIPEGTKWEAPSMRVPAVPGAVDSLFIRFRGQHQALKSTQNPGNSAHNHRYSAQIAGNSAHNPEYSAHNPKYSAHNPEYSAHFPEYSAHNLENSTQNNEQSVQEPSGIGSNAWAIAPQHTTDSAAILCNDPHLGLNLPSLWYEVQLTAPGINCYGVSLPGAPGVVIGFNDSISWGLTNNYRDVKDYYDIRRADADHYWFNGTKTAFQKRVERMGVKGAPDVLDTVLYTVHGPVQYPDTNGHMLAMQWMAHRATNELLAVWLLNRAPDYDQFTQAIQHFECPAQNMMYADRKGNIAQWGQGRFINKWKGQGRFVMEGQDSSTLWGDDIPMAENPHALNPAQGFLVGANQTNTDSTYPYWYNGTFAEWRSWRIDSLLTELGEYKATVKANDDPKDWGTHQDRPPLHGNHVTFIIDSFATGGRATTIGMKEMQNDVISLVFDLLPGKVAWDSTFQSRYEGPRDSLPYFIRSGDLFPRYSYGTIYSIGRYFFYKNVWEDEFQGVSTKWPSTERTIQLIVDDTASSYYDDKTTPQKETLSDIRERSFSQTLDSLEQLRSERAALGEGQPGRVNDSTLPLQWYKVKNTTLLHLAKIPAFSFYQLKTGGDGTCINAMKERYGPSWRMIVQMGRDSIEAYGVYPGGQSGNPGSPFYSDFIAKWEVGDYWRLLFIPAGTAKKPDWVKWVVRMEAG